MCCFFEDRAGAIGAAVVDEEELRVRRTGGERLEGAHVEASGLVEAGHDHDEGRAA